MIVFLVVLFLLKNTQVFQKSFNFIFSKKESGLVYGTTTIKDIINKDTDGDTVLDWEESLWGTDPEKKETTPGVPDDIAIEKLKIERGMNKEDKSLLGNETETEKFSRELFTTITALNQSGELDSATVEKLGSSLAENIQNIPQKIIYKISDIKNTEDESKKAYKKYNDDLNFIFDVKYPIKQDITEILQEFIADENNINIQALSELEPIIKQKKNIVDSLLKITIPKNVAALHLDFINSLQKEVENISNIKYYDTDPIIALGAVSQYEQDTTTLGLIVLKLKKAIDLKLNN